MLELILVDFALMKMGTEQVFLAKVITKAKHAENEMVHPCVVGHAGSCFG